MSALPNTQLLFPNTFTHRLDLPSARAATPSGDTYRSVFQQLGLRTPQAQEQAAARQMLESSLQIARDTAEVLPDSPDQISSWTASNTKHVHAQYQVYLRERKDGSPRKYFAHRSHALYFLKHAAPTKLVDGAWLYGLCAYPHDGSLLNLITTYLEELGDGHPSKNHVSLYRRLLGQHGISPTENLADDFYQQAAIQLALGWNASDFLPEIVGFNLAYEQLPLHLLITAFELNELGIDPYYFVLHQTIDNHDTGHAKRAVEAAFDCEPKLIGKENYWKRVRAGAKLGNLGVNTEAIIYGFDLEREVHQIFIRKAAAGQGAHSNYCKLEGRSINDWLSEPTAIPQMLAALQKRGWIKRNRPAGESHFWQLLVGERAEMFGVFSPYELQLIDDWISGPANIQGAGSGSAAYLVKPPPSSSVASITARTPSFRASLRLSKGSPEDATSVCPPSVEEKAFIEEWKYANREEKWQWLVQAMAPSVHWSAVGQTATKLYSDLLHGTSH